MTIQEASHDMQMVPAHQWQTFLSEVTQKYQGRLVSIEVDGEELVGGRPASQVPLQGIEYRKHKGINLATGAGEETETHIVKAPDLLWAAHDQHGELLGLEIVGRDGRTLGLRLEP